MTEKFISKDKLSKKERKKLNAARRGSWNGANPVTKVVESKKVYNRKKEKQRIRKDEF